MKKAYVLKYALDIAGDYIELDSCRFAIPQKFLTEFVSDQSLNRWRTTRIGENRYLGMYAVFVVNATVKNRQSKRAFVGRIWVPKYQMRGEQIGAIHSLNNARQMQWEVERMADAYDAGDAVDWEGALDSGNYDHAVAYDNPPSVFKYRYGRWILDISLNE